MKKLTKFTKNKAMKLAALAVITTALVFGAVLFIPSSQTTIQAQAAILHIPLQSITDATDSEADDDAVTLPNQDEGNGTTNNNNNTDTTNSFKWWMGLSAVLGLIILATFSTLIIRFFKRRKYDANDEEYDDDDWNW